MKLFKYAYERGTRSTYYSYNNLARKEYYTARAHARSYQELHDRISAKGDDANYYFYTDKTIKPFGIKFGSSVKDAKRILGKPNYELEFDKSDLHKVVFYKKRVDSYKYILQLHFLDDELVYAMDHVYENFKLNDYHLLELTKLLLFKYTNKTHNELTSSQITLVDSKDNRITIIDSLEYNICYSTGNAFTLARLQHLIEKENDHTIKSKLRSKIAMLNFL
jgi:hypothetical protein